MKEKIPFAPFMTGLSAIPENSAARFRHNHVFS